MANKRKAMSKQEFNQQLVSLLLVSSQKADILSAETQTERYARALETLREHDPVLADMIREADEAELVGLQRIVKHLSQRVDN